MSEATPRPTKLPTLYHSKVCLFNCLTTKPQGGGLIVATCHGAVVECETFHASDFAALLVEAVNRDHLFEELVAFVEHVVHEVMIDPEVLHSDIQKLAVELSGKINGAKVQP